MKFYQTLIDSPEMNTLIAISGLGVFCLIAEIFNLRKLLVPVAITVLLAILGLTVAQFNTPELYNNPIYNNMIVVCKFSVPFSSLLITLTIFLVALSGDFYTDYSTTTLEYISFKNFLLSVAY